MEGFTEDLETGKEFAISHVRISPATLYSPESETADSVPVSIDGSGIRVDGSLVMSAPNADEMNLVVLDEVSGDVLYANIFSTDEIDKFIDYMPEGRVILMQASSFEGFPSSFILQTSKIGGEYPFRYPDLHFQSQYTHTFMLKVHTHVQFHSVSQTRAISKTALFWRSAQTLAR